MILWMNVELIMPTLGTRCRRSTFLKLRGTLSIMNLGFCWPFWTAMLEIKMGGAWKEWLEAAWQVPACLSHGFSLLPLNLGD